MRIDIRWPQVVVLCVTLACVAWVLTHLPAAFWEHVDWTVAAPAIGTAITAIVSAFLGRAVKRAEVPPRDTSIPPPVPAAEAKRRHVATARGEGPTTVPRERRAGSDDVTLDGPDEDVDPTT